MNDLKLAVRRLLRSPGFAAITLLTLGLGIGLNSTVFSVLNRLLLQPSPFPHPERCVTVFSQSPQSDFLTVSPGDYCDLRDQNSCFESTGTFTPNPGSLVEGNHPALAIQKLDISAEFLQVLGISPERGRAFTQAEEERQDGRALLTHRFWIEHYSGDPTVIGRTVTLDTHPTTIVGILPASMDDPLLFYGPTDVWALDYPGVNRQRRDASWFYVKARLKPNVTLAQARAQLAILSQRFAKDFPKTDATKQFGVKLDGPNDLDSDTATLCWLTQAITALVLVIACVNLANLQLVRASGRSREHAVRIAIGGTRWAVVRTQATECLLLALAGGGLGILLSLGGDVLAQRYLGSYFDVAFHIAPKVVAFALGLSAATGVVFGVIPTWLATGGGVAEALKQGTRGTSSGKSRHQLRKLLIASEIALTLAVLTGAGYFLVGIQRLLDRKLGWSADNVLVGEVVLPYSRYGEDRDCLAFGDKLLASLRTLPGVREAALSRSSPVWGYAAGGDTSPFQIRDQANADPNRLPQGYYNSVSPRFFDSLSMRLVAGRKFSEDDRPGHQRVIIVNQDLAAAFWPGQDPIGKFIGVDNADRPVWAQIVGVVADTQSPGDLGPSKAHFEIYESWFQRPRQWISFAVHTSQSPALLGAQVRREVTAIDPALLVVWMQTANDAMDDSVALFRLVAKALAAISTAGVLLSAIGIYGVIANLTAERTREIGVRMALGATPGSVHWLIARQGLVLACVGIVAGLGVTAVGIFLLERILPLVPGRNDLVVGLLAIGLFVVALLSSWIPARRAIKVNPVTALRAE